MASAEKNVDNSAVEKLESQLKITSLQATEIVKIEDVIFKLRDINEKMVNAWKETFGTNEKFEVSKGDIFKDGPAADAIVSPANSFGFMDGGIDMAISLHFGWQLQERLQRVIREKHRGELLVGKAEIIPIFEPGQKEPEDIKGKWVGCNGGKPIKFLISAPTMRVPQDVSNTVNAYLAFRGIILAVDEHNKNPENEPIRSVLCPGLGTAVGRMPAKKCAFQISEAYKTLVEKDPIKVTTLLVPEVLEEAWLHDQMMTEYGYEDKGSVNERSRKH